VSAFWGHDASFEVPFFIEAGRISWMHLQPTADEPGLLSAFDLIANGICAAQARYSGRNREAHNMVAACGFRPG